jgi:hypothetical protein
VALTLPNWPCHTSWESVAGFPPTGPELDPDQVMWHLWWTKLHLGSTSVSPARYLHIHHLPSGAGTTVLLVGDVPSGLSLTTPHEINIYIYKGKAIPVRGREGPWDCETSRLPHFLDNQLSDGGQVVSLMRQSPFTPRKIPGTHFC